MHKKRIVRPAAPKDIDAVNALRAPISELHAAGRPDVFKPGFPDGHRARLAAMLRAPQRYDALVCEEKGRLLGFALVEYVHIGETAGMYAQHYAHVLELGVEENARGQGAGRQLMQAVAQRAAQRGCTAVRLDVWEFNAAARAFYEALGYASSVREMELALPAGAQSDTNGGENA